MKRDEVLHVAIGQKGSGYNSGSGGTFVIRKYSNGSFERILIAGGGGGDSFEAKNSYKNEWCNAQLNEYGNGSKYNERNSRIGLSGTSAHPASFKLLGYNGGAGYKTSPPNSEENYPKGFKGGLQGARSEG